MTPASSITSAVELLETESDYVATLTRVATLTAERSQRCGCLLGLRFRSCIGLSKRRLPVRDTRCATVDQRKVLE